MFHTSLAMILIVAAVCAAGVQSFSWKSLQRATGLKGSATKHMVIDEVSKLESALLLRGAPMFAQGRRPSPKASVGAPFHWESCGPANQLVDIKNLTFQPDPLSFPGPLTFGFNIIFHDTISQETQVSADLKLQVNARGTWIEIPCIGSVGSCTYDDLCELTQNIKCPSDLQEQGIPCSCPFDKGQYKLKKYSVEVDAAVLPSGDYKAQVILKEAPKKQIGCYRVAFSVA